MKPKPWWLAILALLVACNDTKKAKEEVRSVIVGVSISSIETNPFFQAAHKAYINVASTLPNTKLLIDAADNNQDKQNQQIDDFVAKGAGALVINLAQVSYGARMVSDLCKRKIPVVFFNRSPGEANLHNCPTAYFVDGDAVEGGRLQGEQVVRAWESNPAWDKNKNGVIEYAMLKGIPDHEGTLARAKWSVATINFNPRKNYPTTMIFEEFAMFQKDKAKALVSTWIQDSKFQEVELIMANNDTMALGAVEALKENNLSIPVFGIDATSVGLKAWLDGDLAGTIFNDSVAQAEVSLKMAANLAAGKAVMDGISYPILNRTVKIRYHDVNKDNYTKYMSN